jgi:GNAT superfamily N-acetyltransferase
MKIELVEDIEDAKSFCKMAFPADAWPGVEHTYWLLKENDAPVGFCSAKIIEPSHSVFLSRAAVIKDARGRGHHLAMIRHRIAWAQQEGCNRAITYAVVSNGASIKNLLDADFQIYSPKTPYAGRKSVVYFERRI